MPVRDKKPPPPPAPKLPLRPVKRTTQRSPMGGSSGGGADPHSAGALPPPVPKLPLKPVKKSSQRGSIGGSPGGLVEPLSPGTPRRTAHKSASSFVLKRSGSGSGSSRNLSVSNNSNDTSNDLTPTRTRSNHSLTDTLMLNNKLQQELNQVNIQHTQETYFLKLELSTVRQEKEAVENRMAELYRDVQEMQEETKKAKVRPVVIDADYVKQLQAQIDKHEGMIRILNNQISLVRTSSDSVVRSLKDEISDLMDEKCRVEMDLMNRMAVLEKENQDLSSNIASNQASSRPTIQRSLSASSHSGRSFISAPDLNGTSDHGVVNVETKKIKAELQRLTRENRRLNKELNTTRKARREDKIAWEEEKAQLSNEIDKLSDDVLVLRSSSEAVQRLGQMQDDREETLATLERVATLWDRADESIQSLESVIMELGLARQDQTGGVDNEDRERALSTLETASLVHGQVKVSLMLIELKLRNNLACLTNDQAQMGSMAPPDSLIKQRLDQIQEETMSAVANVEDLLNKQIVELGQQSVTETRVVRETLQSKVEDLQRMQSRQTKLENEITKLQSNDKQDPAPEATESSDGSVELFVSRKVLERLQDEVMEVVERVKDKNEEIGRLTAMVEEHKVRENSLMTELRRHIQEQAERQVAEQARLMEQLRLRDKGQDDEDGPSVNSELSGSDWGTEAEQGRVAQSVEEVTVEEEVVEEEILEEVSEYDEATYVEEEVMDD